MPTFTAPRRPLVAAVATIALVLGGSPVPSQAAPGDRDPADDVAVEERLERDQARERRAALEDEIDLLRSSDVELRAERNLLEQEIGSLERRRADAARRLEDLSAERRSLRRERAELQELNEQHRQLAVERAVASYMQPSTEQLALVLAAPDRRQLDQRYALLNAVAAQDNRVVDERQRLDEELRRVDADLAGSERETQALQEARRADLDELRERRARLEEVRAALAVRIDEFQQEAEALAAEEVQLTQLIAQRRAAAATTTTTTTTVPPTTTAPPTTVTTAPPTTGPGSGGGGGQTTTTAAPTTTSPPPTTTTTAPSSSASLAWPTAGPVTSPYGFRWGRLHAGIDIGAPTGQPIVAAAGGTVFYAGELGAYGLLTLIDHGDGMVTAYAHQSRFAVTGGSVSRGQTIGYVGSTGRSTGPHLHFEVRIDDVAVDPMPYLR